MIPSSGHAPLFDWRHPMLALPHIVGRIVKRADPLRIYLFGSHARGDAGEGSDLDLLVIVDASDNLRRSASQMQAALAGTGVPVDIVVGTPEIIDKFRDYTGYVYHQALRDGVLVYERR